MSKIENPVKLEAARARMANARASRKKMDYPADVEARLEDVRQLVLAQFIDAGLSALKDGRKVGGHSDRYFSNKLVRGSLNIRDMILLNDYLTFGIVMVKANDADGMVAGACHSTADTLRPALQILKTAPGVKLVSAFFVMDTVFKDQGENGTFLFADCGLNQDPTPEELAAIADTSSRSFKSLIGPKPVIAMLSHSTKGSAKHALVDKVVEATRIAHEEYPHLTLDGELQLDAALVPSVAKSKAPGSPVNGHANVLIFPNLDAGNIGYKLVQRLGGAEAYGPMLQGIAKPVNDLSRGCSWQDIVGVVALTAVQAQLV